MEPLEWITAALAVAVGVWIANSFGSRSRLVRDRKKRQHLNDDGGFSSERYDG